jgi:putative NADPH-quinone reductase
VLEDNGHEVAFHDLCEERFDPVLPYEEIPRDAEIDPLVSQHCVDIQDADGIVVVHPSWWGQPPAILKGWIDRVIRVGVAYEFHGKPGEPGAPVGLLKAENAIVINTSNTPREVEIELFGDILENIWKTSVFKFCGVKNVERLIYSPVLTSTPEQREEWLNDVQEHINHMFPAEKGMRATA